MKNFDRVRRTFRHAAAAVNYVNYVNTTRARSNIRAYVLRLRRHTTPRTAPQGSDVWKRAVAGGRDEPHRSRTRAFFHEKSTAKSLTSEEEQQEEQRWPQVSVTNCRTQDQRARG